MNHLLWLRRELRIHDNPLLVAAATNAASVAPVYAWDSGRYQHGGASRWWLHHSLASLEKDLARLGSPLRLLSGVPEKVLVRAARECNADAVFWNRATDPAGRAEDDTVETALKEAGISCRIFSGTSLLSPLLEPMNQAGEPFKVFTPYWKRAAALPLRDSVPAPSRLQAPPGIISSVPLDSLALLPQPDWAQGLRENWQPGESGAQARLESFVEHAMMHYDGERDIPGREGTSRLSPHLHFGEISPITVVHAVRRRVAEQRGLGAIPGEAFIRQLYWREFAHYLLYHFPHMHKEPMYPEYRPFPWRDDPVQERLWQRGLTGYPIVDAGMRELWVTGWMHNRVRMIVGSFLVKDLLLPWQSGAAWFQDTLVDADSANNTLGWQWVGGCGPDAAPYFRVFNPTLQGERYDPDGAYVRRWLPELARLPNKYLHAPYKAPESVLSGAGVTLGKEYPLPVVDHQAARERALSAFSVIRAGKRSD